MTRSRSTRGRRRNRDRAVNPEEQTTGQPDAAADGPAQEQAPLSPSVQAAVDTGTSSPERRRRRQRGGQGQNRQEARPAGDGANQTDQTSGAPERQTRPGGDRNERRSRPTAEQDDRRGRLTGDGRDDAGRRQNRRRPARRPTIVPATGEVFKPGVRVTSPAVGPSMRRPAVLVDGDGQPVLGCPMLTQTRMEMPFAGGVRVPRCALAWAIHSEAEASLCMETPVVAQCWKLHPERIAEIEERLADRAAD